MQQQHTRHAHTHAGRQAASRSVDGADAGHHCTSWQRIHSPAEMRACVHACEQTQGTQAWRHASTAPERAREELCREMPTAHGSRLRCNVCREHADPRHPPEACPPQPPSQHTNTRAHGGSEHCASSRRGPTRWMRCRNERCGCRASGVWECVAVGMGWSQRDVCLEQEGVG